MSQFLLLFKKKRKNRLLINSIEYELQKQGSDAVLSLVSRPRLRKYFLRGHGIFKPDYFWRNKTAKGCLFPIFKYSLMENQSKVMRHFLNIFQSGMDPARIFDKTLTSLIDICLLFFVQRSEQPFFSLGNQYGRQMACCMILIFDCAKVHLKSRQQHI